MPEIQDLLIKHKPILQVETWGKHKQSVEAFLFGIGYRPYDLDNGILRPLEDMENRKEGDLLFIHPHNDSVLAHLAAKGLFSKAAAATVIPTLSPIFRRAS